LYSSFLLSVFCFFFFLLFLFISATFIHRVYLFSSSRHTSAGIVTKLRAGRPSNHSWFLAKERQCYLLQSVETHCLSHWDSCRMCTFCYSAGTKRRDSLSVPLGLLSNVYLLLFCGDKASRLTVCPTGTPVECVLAAILLGQSVETHCLPHWDSLSVLLGLLSNVYLLLFCGDKAAGS